MENKIVVITSEYLHPFVSEAYQEIELPCEVEVVKYRDFETISEVYKKYEDSVRGFVVSGQIAKEAIIKAIPDYKKPIAYFQADSAAVYRMMLEYLMGREKADPKRIIFDFLLTTHEEASMDYYINVLNLPLIRTDIDAWADKVTMKDIIAVERMITEKIISLWEAKKIDGAICLYSSVIPELKERGIPCDYPLPEKDQLKEMALHVLAQSELKDMSENLPAVIAVGCAKKNETEMARLKAALKEIKRNLGLDIILKEEKETCQLYTSKRLVELLTDEQRFCNLTKILREDHGIEVMIGYGIGRSITAAKMHAEDAVKEAEFGRSSYIMDEKKTLIGPLGGNLLLEVKGNVSKEVSEIAEKCKLSTLTIQKLSAIIKMNGSNRLTTQELAERLGVTIRNANRILKNLEDGGAAVITHRQSSISKGRPVKVYELNI